MKKLLVAGFIFYSTAASGVISIDGKFYGKTATDFMVLSQGEIFTFKKSALNKIQLAYLEKLRWQDLVHIDVPTRAIERVKSAPK